MAEEPVKALYFVTRNDGRMVPLLAVDELPHHIVISNVSRIMSVFDIAGMTCVGHADFRYRHHVVHSAPELAASNAVQSQDALKARYFITRDSGNMVPLIAMDEMPEYFVVDGVPRTVSVFDIIGMTCVGASGTRERLHVVEDVNNAPLSYFAERSAASQAAIASDVSPGTQGYGVASSVFNSPPQSAIEPGSPAGSTTRMILSPEVDFLHTTIRTPQQHARTPLSVTTDGFGNIESIISCPPSRQSSITPADETQTPSIGLTIETLPAIETPSPESLTTGVKQYCSYWIRHGECDYQQQGCLYKHEMPLDEETLNRLGLRDIPRWYREKHQLGSYLATGGSGASFSGESLKSATASGKHKDDRQGRIAGHWRGGSPRANRRGNTYNPRSDRSGLQSASLSRYTTPRRRSPFFGGRHRGVETSSVQQQLNAFPALSSFSTRGRSHRRSTSTIMSDIEATVHREDLARKAREDAEYAIVVSAEQQKGQQVAEEYNETSDMPKSPESTRGRRGSGGNRRGGKGGEGRGRDKRYFK